MSTHEEVMDLQRQWLDLVNECYDSGDLDTLIPLVNRMHVTARKGGARNVAVILFGYGAAAIELAKYGGHEFARRKREEFWDQGIEDGSLEQSEAEYEAFWAAWSISATRHPSRPFCVSDAQWVNSIPRNQKNQKKGPIIVRFCSEVDSWIRA